ncbi:MAG: efflux RND transporter periplasmic adaptor subunit [Paracoccaceae bacterium]|nr:MAG: efflux RND transporter periplasmic adaptor subunit [Paracoccaceae bacterium]
MRFLPLLTAALVSATLYLLVFERDRLTAFASGDAAAAPDAAPVIDAPPGAAEMRRISVVVRQSTAQEVDNGVLARGQTEAARQVEVRSETSGLVISEPLRRGAYVAAGQVLCELDPGTRAATLAEAEARLSEARSRLPEAQARVVEAQARLNEAQMNDRAAVRLSEGGFASETRVAGTQASVESARAAVESARSGLSAAASGISSAEAAVESARREIDKLTVRAPFDGLLESDAAELGALLQPGSPCATVIQLDPIKLVGFVSETDVDKIEVGAMAGARLVSGRQVAGRVTFLSRSADPLTRTFRVEVTVPNSDLAIRDGQTAEMLIAAEGRSAHLLPSSALTLDDDGKLGVRIVDGESRAQFVPVTILRDTPQGVWLSGLPDTATVILVGQEFVTDGVEVTAVVREVAP